MELESLLVGLSDPHVYGETVESVELRQTHISVVCLTEDLVYKIRKPVQFSFLDFSTLEKRHRDCEREVELNRRLAPDVYLGIVPICVQDGQFHVGCATDTSESVLSDGSGKVVEWAVKMRRLPEAATLKQRLKRADVEPETMRILGRRLAEFHAAAAAGPEIAAYGTYSAVSRNLLATLNSDETSKINVGNQTHLLRLEGLMRARLIQAQNVIELRADQCRPCDTHGDLRLDHVYVFPDRQPPADLCIIDCIEFNDGFRYADPVSDIAFLIMDLRFYGRDDLARVLSDAYFAATGDVEGLQLLPLYVSYRSAVRAKVAMLEFAEPEIPEVARIAARERASGHLLLALDSLEVPSRRPGLVLVGGLQGTGKSTLARGLAEAAGFIVIRTDVVRKELAGVLEGAPASADGNHSRKSFQQTSLYSEDWTNRTYDECMRRSLDVLREGGRVIVDGTFSRERHRQQFLDAARRLSVRGLLLNCQADPDLVRRRLEQRTGDASDADFHVYLAAVKKWESASDSTHSVTTVIESGESAEFATESALSALRQAGLLN